MQDSSYMASKSSLLIVFKSSLYFYFCFLDISIIRDLLKFPTTMVRLSIPPVVLLNFYFMCFKAILLDPISLTLCFTGNKILSSVESSFLSLLIIVLHVFWLLLLLLRSLLFVEQCLALILKL